VREGQPFVVDAQLMEHRSLKVADVDGVPSDIVAEVVSFAVTHPALDPAAGHPGCEAAGMVVATVIVSVFNCLGEYGSAKFPGKDDERVFEKTSLFQILQQGCNWLVDISSLAAQVSRQASVVIPATMEKLNEADIPFGHPPGEQAVASK